MNLKAGQSFSVTIVAKGVGAGAIGNRSNKVTKATVADKETARRSEGA